jgi:predicted dehydrogenase
MQAILEDLRSGKVASYEVPHPELLPGGILVRTAFSAISTGTERSHREQVDKSLVGKAMARPDLVKQVIDFARKEGIQAAYQRVKSRLDTLSPLGYSCAGVVLAAGSEAQEFQPGDRVACAGVGYASHCEINYIPKNLAAHVPDTVPLDAAALTTIGSIALQGFRQCQAVLGETVVVIGAGLVGLLTAQLAKAAGCRVVAIDLDPGRAEQARQLGADAAFCSADNQIAGRVQEFTRYGADAAILTAATSSTAPIELAAKLLRDRGRITVVGAVGLGVSRAPMYSKELSLNLSRSYGPGRYDPNYEEGGLDYPIGYVRWTEKRNMEAFLDLLSSGAIVVKPLLERRCKADQAAAAYEQLNGSGTYTVIIEYPNAPAEHKLTTACAALQPAKPPRAAGEVRISCVGAGAFARDVIFPALQRTKGVVLHSVATRSGTASEAARKVFGFSSTATPAEAIEDPESDALFVLSRHSSHAGYVLAALANHKPVFVEKPLAVTREELEKIKSAYEAETEKGHPPFLMVGFNRRFAPFSGQVRKFFAGRREPMVLLVRINAGYIARDHWAQRSSEGGRIIGEFCHFVDWARSVVGTPIVRVSANALPDGTRYNRDNVFATLSFADGSIASLAYLANGDSGVAKEHFEVFCGGGVATINDFCTLDIVRGGRMQRSKAHRDKGHNREIALTVEAMRTGGPSPIPIAELLEVSHATLAVLDSIAAGQPISLPDYTSHQISVSA